jgi:hypothetical protein
MAYVIDTRERPGHGRAPHQGAISRSTEHKQEIASPQAPALTDDTGRGLALFVLFTTAVLVVTGAVALLALMSSWWVLGLAFGIHVLFTILVGCAVFAVLGDRNLALSRGGSDSVDAAHGSQSQPAARASADQAFPIAA